MKITFLFNRLFWNTSHLVQIGNILLLKTRTQIEEVEIELHSFLIPQLDGGEWQASSLGSFTSTEEHPLWVSEPVRCGKGKTSYTFRELNHDSSVRPAQNLPTELCRLQKFSLISGTFGRKEIQYIEINCSRFYGL